MKLNKKKLIISILIVIILSSAIFYLVYFKSKDAYTEISYKSFLEEITQRNVSEVMLDDNSKIKGKLKDGELFITDNPRTEDFKEYLLLNGIKVVESDENNTFQNLFMYIFVLIGIGGMIFLLNKNVTGQAQKEITQMSTVDNSNKDNKYTTFEDVAGNEEAKENLKELVDFIRNPEKYQKYGARMPRGILLYGPPGTGKTLLAKGLAGEAGVPFYAVSGSDFIQVYAGLGASRIRNLFKKARQEGKCVIFIDEIDALGKKRRGTLSGGNDESDRTLNALLTEMSGFNGNEGIIVIAATNRIDTLDEALLRPGRFDRQIEVGLPDVNARHKILRLHSKNKPLSKSVDLMKVAYETVYFSGAKLESLMNESAILAAKNNNEVITMDHIDKAFYSIMVGEEKKDRTSVSLDDKKITAFHEAGHALVSKLVLPNNRVTKVTIIPSTKGTGGFSMSIPQDKMYQTKEELINQIMVLLGGRAAEEIVFGTDKITTGASNDLSRATNIIMTIVAKLGMDEKLGLLNYEAILGDNIGSSKYVLDRCKEITMNLYKKTKEVISGNLKQLNQISNILLEKESIGEEELNSILEI